MAIRRRSSQTDHRWTLLSQELTLYQELIPAHTRAAQVLSQTVQIFSFHQKLKYQTETLILLPKDRSYLPLITAWSALGNVISRLHSRFPFYHSYGVLHRCYLKFSFSELHDSLNFRIPHVISTCQFLLRSGSMVFWCNTVRSHHVYIAALWNEAINQLSYTSCRCVLYEMIYFGSLQSFQWRLTACFENTSNYILEIIFLSPYMWNVLLMACLLLALFLTNSCSADDIDRTHDMEYIFSISAFRLIIAAKTKKAVQCVTVPTRHLYWERRTHGRTIQIYVSRYFGVFYLHECPSNVTCFDPENNYIFAEPVIQID